MARPKKFDTCHCGERKLVKRDFCASCYSRLTSILKSELFQEPSLYRDRAVARARMHLFGSEK